ncbi:hypothetical protein Ga0061061_11199 [Chelatococcus sambhunathii]|uniref:Uncharacterized protein n=1 Tax=Chelatococcus sambhunathii TaxID=363953 RepID=A0ABM9U8V0_9HYPH|nr:hypothetical protein Ga0061061_11199 [Chelatococcus sambhunathii]
MWPACAVAAGHFLCRALYDAFEVLCLAAFVSAVGLWAGALGTGG